MFRTKLILAILFTLISIVLSASSEYCKLDAECMELNYCDSKNQKCLHKPIFTDLTKEIIGLILITFGSALSNAGGIGGGGLLIPILLLILNFYTHEAIPISKLMIFTGAITSFLLGFRQKHPTRKSITIEYNIPMLLVPMLLFGTMVGVTLNKVTPPWLILVSLTLVLVINTYKTLKKGKNLYEIENKKIEIMNKEMKIVGNESQNVSVDRKNVNDNSLKDSLSISSDSTVGKSNTNANNLINETETKGNYSQLNMSGNMEELLKEEEEKDLRKFPFDKIIYMVISYVFMLVINFLKGSDYLKSIIGIEICSLEYWIIYFIFLPFALIMTYIISRKIKQEYDYRLSIGYPYNSTDIKWDDSAIFIKFPIYSFISGMMAGLLGIGGGLILGPLLLELGLHPMVSTATSNFLVLFTSSSTSIQFILLGMMNLDFGIACTIASTIGSFVGTILIHKLLIKTGRNSYIVFVLGAVLGVSTVLIPIHTLMQLIEKLQEGKSIWQFNKPC